LAPSTSFLASASVADKRRTTVLGLLLGVAFLADAEPDLLRLEALEPVPRANRRAKGLMFTLFFFFLFIGNEEDLRLESISSTFGSPPKCRTLHGERKGSESSCTGYKI
jgi:hypothetical protein